MSLLGRCHCSCEGSTRPPDSTVCPGSNLRRPMRCVSASGFPSPPPSESRGGGAQSQAAGRAELRTWPLGGGSCRGRLLLLEGSVLTFPSHCTLGFPNVKPTAHRHLAGHPSSETPRLMGWYGQRGPSADGSVVLGTTPRALLSREKYPAAALAGSENCSAIVGAGPGFSDLLSQTPSEPTASVAGRPSVLPTTF